MSRADAGTAQGFSLVIPVCTAREAQLLTALAELLLCYGSVDRFGGKHPTPDIEESYLLTRALELLALGLTEHVLPEFQQRYWNFWRECDAEHWLTVAGQWSTVADLICIEVQSIRERFRRTSTGSLVSTAPSGPPPDNRHGRSS